MSNFLSPGVLVKEIDLTTSVPAVDSSAAGTVGTFKWGPINQTVLIENEDKLLKLFGRPTTSNNQYWFSAASFLAYSGMLYLVRAASAGFLNAISDPGTEGAPNAAIQIKNDDDWEQNYSAGEAAVGPFAARFAGALGNSLRVSVADSASYATWEFKDLFDGAPATSDYVFERGGSNDEMHIVVQDKLGSFTGIPGTILETYAFVSKASDAKYNDGGTAYYKNKIVNESSYIHWMDHLAVTGIGQPAPGVAFGNLTQAYDATFSKGADDFAGTSDAEVMVGWDRFKSSEEIDVSILFTGPVSPTVSQYVIDNVAESRRDLIVAISPQLADVRGTGIVDKVVAAKNSETGVNRSTSYATFDCNWKMVYDRYNEQNVWIPCNSDIAGLMARTDSNRDPWWSPAGYERGLLKNVVKLAWNPSKTERDILYKSGINPVLNMPGQGPMLYGDKTMLTRPSAFDRINVRRLFLVLEKAIGNASKYSLFQFNDEFTRSQFVNMVTPFLRDVQGRRGIYDFMVVCDETNNTAEVIDRNEFVGSIFIKPAKSTNFVSLNFIATRSGVAFSEVVGGV